MILSGLKMILKLKIDLQNVKDLKLMQFAFLETFFSGFVALLIVSFLSYHLCSAYLTLKAL